MEFCLVTWHAMKVLAEPWLSRESCHIWGSGCTKSSPTLQAAFGHPKNNSAVQAMCTAHIHASSATLNHIQVLHITFDDTRELHNGGTDTCPEGYLR